MLLLNALKTVEGVQCRVFLDESCVCLLSFITLMKPTIQRNKERFWQLEQTAKTEEGKYQFVI